MFKLKKLKNAFFVMGSLYCIMRQSVHRTRSSDCSVSDFQTNLAGIEDVIMSAVLPIISVEVRLYYTL